MTGVDTKGNKPESMVQMLGGDARLVFLIATALLAGGGGLLYWMLTSSVRARCGFLVG